MARALPAAATEIVACPVCGPGPLDLLASRDEIDRELALRREFVTARLEPRAPRGILRDLSDVSFGFASDLFVCRCGVLVRDGRLAPDFENETYPAGVMERLLRTGIEDFRARSAEWRSLLPAGASVVEVGSYVGAFLHVARERGWSATGADIGRDAARFANERGYPTLRTTLEGCAFGAASLDGVFIWNCFEQLEDPLATMVEARRILRPGGALVIRTPNALLYAVAVAARADAHGDALVRLLGFGNLLGFPHRFGFTPDALCRAAAAAGLRVERLRGSAFVSPARACVRPEARAEEMRIAAGAAAADLILRRVDFRLILQPWLECVFRAR
ncbi:MAG: class I SAM-dependent methyltransferase [Thermoanaerobaculia bacterium]